MKKILKKVLILVLIFLTINNFILANNSYANVIGDAIETLGEGLVGILAYPVQIILFFGGMAIDAVTKGVAYIDGAADGADTSKMLTPFDILFNKVKLVDVNFFDFENISDDSIVGKIRIGISAWYYILRLIACAILLVILIYVGIRMALTTIASDKAMYSKMIVDWACSIALIFLLQYIMVFTFSVNDALITAMESIAKGKDVSTAIETIQADSWAFGYKGIGSAAVYFILVTQTIALLISYINRMLKIAFLIVIAPLITLTYSIDKMGDGKAQALGTWFKEFIFTVLMQPFHCIIYMVMVSMALELLTAKTDILDAGERLGFAIFAVLCIRYVQEAEKIVRKIFHFEDDNSGTSVAAGMAMSAMMLSQSKNIGKTLKGGVTSAKNMATSLKTMGTHGKATAIALASMATGKNTVTEKKRDENGNVEKDENGKDIEETKKLSFGDLRERAIANSGGFGLGLAAGKDETDKINKRYKASGSESEDVARIKEKEEDKKRYEALRASGMSHTKAMSTMRKEKLREKADEGKGLIASGRRGINGARGVAQRISQNEGFKEFTSLAKTYASAGVGAAVGVAMFGNGRDLIQSTMMGAAAYGSTQEFMKDTTKTLVDSAAQSMSALNASSPEEARAKLTSILMSDESDFQSNSEEITQALENLKNQLKSLGMDEKTANTFSTKIHKEIKANALSGNPKSMSEILQGNLYKYNNSTEGKAHPIDLNKNTSLVEGAMSQTSDFENKKIIFDNFQKANQATGISAEAYCDQVLRGFTPSTSSDTTDSQSSSSDGGTTGTATNEKTEEEVKEENDKADITHNTEQFDQILADMEKAVETSIPEADVPAEEKAKIKQEIRQELSKLVEDEIKKIEKVQAGDEASAHEMGRELGDILDQIKDEQRVLQEKDKELEAERMTMTPEERRKHEKAKIETEYRRQIVKQVYNYRRDYNGYSKPEE